LKKLKKLPLAAFFISTLAVFASSAVPSFRPRKPFPGLQTSLFVDIVVWKYKFSICNFC
jgi:hypothetical protein